MTYTTEECYKCVKSLINDEMNWPVPPILTTQLSSYKIQVRKKNKCCFVIGSPNDSQNFRLELARKLWWAIISWWQWRISPWWHASKFQWGRRWLKETVLRAPHRNHIHSFMAFSRSDERTCSCGGWGWWRWYRCRGFQSSWEEQCRHACLHWFRRALWYSLVHMP